MRPAAAPTGSPPFPRPAPRRPASRLPVGPVVVLARVAGPALVGGAIWLLTTQPKPLGTAEVDSPAGPAWMGEAQTYPSPEPVLPKTPEPVVDPTAGLMARLAALQAEMDRQRME